MANLEKATKVFNEVLLRFKGSEDNHVRTIAGGGNDFIMNNKITNQTVESYRKQFMDALAEDEPAGTP